MPSLMPPARQQYFNPSTNAPLSGGKLYTYAAGTSTPKATYADSAGQTPNANPITLDANGSAIVYWSGAYKVVLQDSLGNTIYTQDNVNALADTASLGGPTGAQLVGYGTTTLDVLLKSQINSVVTSIANLRALDHTKYTQACVTGYYANGDGGGGIYYYDSTDTTSADNGGTIIVASDGGRWKLQQSFPVSVKQFGAKIDGTTDDGSAISNANTYAASINAELVFPGGQYNIGAGTTFTIDPMKTRWRAEGPAQLRWAANPTSGVAVKIVSSTAAPYETARNMAARVLDGIQILGGTSSASKYAGTGLKIGDGTNETFSIVLENPVVQGFTTLIDMQDNVWWVAFNKPRLLWGAINTPANPTNFGENITFRDPEFIDGVVFTVNKGEFKLYGGSCDNSKVVVNNNAHVAWYGPHFENPGSTTLTQPFVDIQGTEATVHLIDPTLVIDNNGSAITQAPFNVINTNTTNGLILDSVQYTQGGFAGWYSMVSGGGRVRPRAPQILAFSNANYQVIAENAEGQLRNYGFEANNMSGWTTTLSGQVGNASTATPSTTRVHTGTYACLMQVSNANAGYSDVTIAQTTSIRSGQMLMAKFAYNRAYGAAVAGAISAQVAWLDASGAQITTTSILYSSTTGTDDGTTWNTAALNALAPAGTVSAAIQITFQRPSGTGTPGLYVDDVYVNVV